jgi:hypothetical protein
MEWPTPTAETRSLGWALVELIEAELLVPTGLGAKEPIRLTDEQVDLVVAWYEVDARGSFVGRRGAWRLPKKWGKSPLAAAVAYCELVGPVLFSHFDADGDPVGMPHPSPWIQIAACSEDQTDNTFLQLVEMLRDSPAVTTRGLDVGVTRIQFWNQPGRIEPVTSAAGSREGQPITFAVLDQTESWTRQNGGKALAAVLRRNAAPTGARTLETPNAFAPGEGSVAESTHEAVIAGRVAGVLYVAREAPPIEIEDRESIDRKKLHAALAYVYGDSAKQRGGWVDLERLVEEFFDSSNDLAELCRWYLNQIIAPAEALINLVTWAQLVDADGRLVQGDTIALGFDGSDTGDATALVACRWPDYLVVPLAIWERPDSVGEREGWKVNRAEVDTVIRQTMETYRVVRGYFDPPQWQTEIDGWSGEFGDAVLRYPHASDQRIGPACERFTTMVDERTLRHTGDPELLRHLANGRRARCGPQRHGWWRPARKVAGRPIDAASAAICAVHALADAVAKGDVNPPEGFAPLFAFSK